MNQQVENFENKLLENSVNEPNNTFEVMDYTCIKTEPDEINDGAVEECLVQNSNDFDNKFDNQHNNSEFNKMKSKIDSVDVQGIKSEINHQELIIKDEHLNKCNNDEKMTTPNKRRVVHSQGREIIYNVYKFMKEEKESGKLKVPLVNLQVRVATSTGVGVCTVKSIIREGESKTNNAKFITPRKTINKESTKISTEDFEEKIIRNMIYTCFVTNKQSLNMRELFEAVKREEAVNFGGKIDSFRNIVKKLGFRWKKTVDNRKILVEKFDIRHKRIEYLQKLTKLKEEGRNIIYVIEAYLYSSHTIPNNSKNTPKATILKGQRLNVVHAGGANGFVSNASLIFKSGRKPGDYQDEMNDTNFKKWLVEKLIPNINEPSALVVNNHNVTVEPNPTFWWKKNQMQQWLRERNIFFESKETKPELYTKIQLHKPQSKIYEIDKILTEHDIPVLRLPPHHPELNPVEKVWTLVKNQVATCNTTFKIDDVCKLTKEHLNKVTANDWLRICLDVKRIEKEYTEKEHASDNASDLFISINDIDSDESDFYFSEDESVN